MAEGDIWKGRFFLFMAARLFGLLTFLAGLAVAFSDLVRPGGWRSVGTVLIILGLFDAVVGPKLLSNYWKKEDGVAPRKPESGPGDR